MNPIAKAVTDFIADTLEGVASIVGSITKSSASDFLKIETSDSPHALVTSDGALVSGLRIFGMSESIGPDEFENVVAALNRALESFLAAEGHSVNIVASRDYVDVKSKLNDLLIGAKATANRLNLSLTDVVESKAEKLASMCANEDVLLALWTTPKILTASEKSEVNAGKKAHGMTAAPIGRAAQSLSASVAMIQDRHEAFLESVHADISRSGMRCERLTSHMMCREARFSIDPEWTGKDTFPSLPGDPIPKVLRGNNGRMSLDFTDLQYPPLSWYLMPRDAERIDSRFVKVGGRVYAPVFVDVPPAELMPFRSLFVKLHNAGIPWRVSMMVDGGGLGFLSIKHIAAQILSNAPGVQNKLISSACEEMAGRVSRDETVIRLRIAIVTWVDGWSGDGKEAIALLRERASRLARTLAAWGKAEVREVSGDPMGGLISTVPFVSTANAGTPAVAPLIDICRILPIMRPASPWTSGSVLYRSEDGKVMPFDPGPGSGVQNTWNYIFFAPPGYGKSLGMATILLGAVTSPGLKRLPRIAILDIGPSARGIVNMVRDALPEGQRHQAGYFRLRMSADNSINPFDTALGCRFPTKEHLSFVANILTQIATPAEVTVPYDSLSAMVKKIVEALYEKYSDKPRSNPKRYSPGKYPPIDTLLGELDYALNRETTWWEVVDFLFDQGRTHEAGIAQRYAMPILTDAPGPARDKQMQDLYGDVKIATGESLNAAFSRLISDAARDYVVLSEATRFDIGEIKIGAINIEDVAKQGSAAADRQTAIMYLLARHALTKDYRMTIESVADMPARYQAHHAKRVAETFEDPKWVVYDEFHRAAKSPSVVNEVEIDMREGRKWNISVMLASQSVNDFPTQYTEFATGVFILNAGTDENAEKLKELFGFNETAKNLLLNYCHGPTPNGAPFLSYLKTKSGGYTQLLYSTISAIEYWALTTTTEDVIIRERLYASMGPVPARSVLARMFPGGVQAEIRLLKSRMTHEMNADPSDAILDRLLAEAKKV